MNPTVQNKVNVILRQRRTQAEQQSKQKRDALYAQCPELSQLETLINSVYIRKSYLRLGKEMPAKIVSKMQELSPELLRADGAALDRALEKMLLRRKQLLESFECAETAFEPRYTCALCKDTGVVETSSGRESCTCFKILMTEQLRELANLPSNTDTFEQFNACYYPDVVDSKEYGIGVSPRVHMIRMKERCEDFVTHFTEPASPNLLFVGRSGVGKTFLSNCIGSKLLEQGVPVLYMPVSSLFKPFSAAAFAGEEEKETLLALRNLILNVELLIIDDLGTEKQTATRYEEVLEILNTREMNGRNRPCKTIITTNMTPKILFDTYGERVASRILGAFDVLPFCGDDIRLKRKQC